MSILFKGDLDLERHYDVSAAAYKESIENHAYSNAKDWLASLKVLDHRLAEKGEQ